jgi:DNA modification methylase
VKYYEDAHVTLYLGDCLTEHREWLTADVLVTDPPYGTAGGDKRGNDGYGRRVGNQRGVERIGQHIANDGTTETRDRALAAWGEGPAIAFGSPRLPDPPGEWSDRLVWNKTRPGTNGGPFRYMHESIYARGMVRANASTFSVFSIYPDQSDHIHAKPIELMESLVATCPPGTIADPFAGSGSTLVAARNLGRKAIGVELEERYCEIIAKRLQQGAFDLGALA